MKFTDIFKKRKQPLKIGVVFGGGGARGFGHIGVIKAFEEEGIKPHFICGTSIGSLIGAAWANGTTSEKLLEIAKEIREKDIRPSKIIPTPVSAKGIEELAIKVLGGNKLFSDLKIPFTAVAVDINSGKEVHFESGYVAKAVSASSCAPGVFIPVEIDGKHYVDGGLLNNMPTDVAKNKFCDVIIGIDINSSRGNGSETTKLFDVLMATIRIMGSVNAINGYKYADIMIKPDLKRFRVHKFAGSEEMIEEGYAAAKEAMPEIKRLISETKAKSARIKLEIKKKKAELSVDYKAYVQARREENKKLFKDINENITDAILDDEDENA